MVKLDTLLLSQHDAATVKNNVSLPRHEIDEIGDDLEQAACSSLTRIDLSGNLLTSVEGLAKLKNLKWLSVAANQLTSLGGLQKLKKLTVLNCSKNKIVSAQEVLKLKELRALILNENEISSVNGVLDGAVNLDTLVLSHNPLRKLGTSLSKLSSLKKLSLSHCKIKDLGTSLTECTALEELRLAHNRLQQLPKEIELNARLRIVDLGNNKISTWKNVEVLQKLPGLKNLNLRGNPLADESNYAEKVMNMVSRLQVFDGRPTDNNRRKPKQQKQKRKAGVQQLQQPESSTVVESTGALKESEESVPFAALIASEMKDAPAGTAKTSDTNAKRGISQSKQDSKVVSVMDKERSKKHGKKQRVGSSVDGSGLANALETADIGMGGPSSWDS